MTDVLIALVISAVSAVVTYLLTRKKNDADVRKTLAEADNTELEAVDKAIKIWRELASELGNQVSKLSVRCDELGKQIESLTKENHLLQRDLKKLRTSFDNNTIN